MTRAGNLEYVRRAGTLVLCVAGFMCLQRPALAGMFFPAGLALYLFLPSARLPQRALVHDWLPAVVIPDVLGFALASLFFAMPVWFAWGDGSLVGGIHPMAVLTWPLACGSSVILVVAANHASAWLRIDDDGLLLASARHIQHIPYGAIVTVEPWSRGLPAWMRALAPWLAATGHYTAAGAISLARNRKGVRLRLANGCSAVIERDGFERPYRQALAALAAHGVPFNAVAAAAGSDQLEKQSA